MRMDSQSFQNLITNIETHSISYNSSSDEVMVVNKNGLYKALVGTTMNPTYTLAETGLPSID